MSALVFRWKQAILGLGFFWGWISSVSIAIHLWGAHAVSVRPNYIKRRKNINKSSFLLSRPIPGFAGGLAAGLLLMGPDLNNGRFGGAIGLAAAAAEPSGISSTISGISLSGRGALDEDVDIDFSRSSGSRESCDWSSYTSYPAEADAGLEEQDEEGAIALFVSAVDEELPPVADGHGHEQAGRWWLVQPDAFMAAVRDAESRVKAAKKVMEWSKTALKLPGLGRVVRASWRRVPTLVRGVGSNLHPAVKGAAMAYDVANLGILAYNYYEENCVDLTVDQWMTELLERGKEKVSDAVAKAREPMSITSWVPDILQKGKDEANRKRKQLTDALHSVRASAGATNSAEE